MAANKKLRDEYFSVKGYVDKKKFRAEWARGEYEKWAKKHEVVREVCAHHPGEFKSPSFPPVSVFTAVEGF